MVRSLLAASADGAVVSAAVVSTVAPMTPAVLVNELMWLPPVSRDERGPGLLSRTEAGLSQLFEVFRMGCLPFLKRETIFPGPPVYFHRAANPCVLCAFQGAEGTPER
jgi:hypothetical protein